MNHTHFQQLISEFIDRELGPEGEAELFAHLGICTECRKFLKKSVRLQADVAISKFKVVMTKRVETLQSHAPERPALLGVSYQTKYAGFRTIALLAIIVLVAGLFWSTTLPRENPDRFDLMRQRSPSEIPTYQP